MAEGAYGMLTGEAKKLYQREYMRSYMRERRALGLKFPYQTKSSPGKSRFEILKRDGFRCQYCGSTAKDGVKLEIDHIRPICKGGTDEESNLITACLQCNRSKGGQLFDYDIEQTMMSRVLTTADDFRPQFDADGDESFEGREQFVDPCSLLPSKTFCELRSRAEALFNPTDVPSVRTDPGSQERASPAVIVKTQVQHDNPMMVGYVPLPR